MSNNEETPGCGDYSPWTRGCGDYLPRSLGNGDKTGHSGVVPRVRVTGLNSRLKSGSLHYSEGLKNN